MREDAKQIFVMQVPKMMMRQLDVIYMIHQCCNNIVCVGFNPELAKLQAIKSM